MTRKTVVTLKIRPAIFDLVHSGIKKYEVRDSSLEGVDVICYLNSETGELLGSYSVDNVTCVDRGADEMTIMRSGVERKVFYDLFPPVGCGGPKALWVARIQGPVELDRVLGIG